MKASTASKRSGILAGGNWIIDQVKIIDAYPAEETLANIKSQHQGTGGSPFNLLVDLAKLGAGFPLSGAGLVGKDALGEWILAHCAEHKIETKHLKATADASTSYTDVMTVQGNGKRTFFHNRGANALWDGKDLDFTKTKARIFHLGYLLLLDKLDVPNKDGITGAAKMLAAAQAAGIRTSIDVVSEFSERFKTVVRPALKHCDYAIINEYEAGNVAGFKIRKEGVLDTVSLRHAAGAILQLGVRELVVIHFPEGCFARTRDGKDHWQSSLKVPDKAIAGSAGAGDAFAAGVLYGLHEGWELQRCLLTGCLVAASSLSDPTCTGGIKPLDQVEALKKKYGLRKPLEPEEDY
jgi:sugar/nucleoside kinase (ribokinase family)